MVDATSSSSSKAPVLEPELVQQVNESFDAVDEDKSGYITDKDHIYALFLSMGITFDSEEEFNSSVLSKVEVLKDDKTEDKDEESKDL